VARQYDRRHDTVLPLVGRLRRRFGIERICVVADRGMVSKETIKKLEDAGLQYILGGMARRFVIRSDGRGWCGKAYQAAGVAMAPTLRLVGAEVSG
jgi:hypothetical protein